MWCGIASALLLLSVPYAQALQEAQIVAKPSLVAQKLVNIEDDWKAQLDLSVQCNAPGVKADVQEKCHKLPNLFQQACAAIAKSFVHLNSNDKHHFQTFMQSVCEDEAIKPDDWRHNACLTFGLDVLAAVPFREDREYLGVCRTMWSNLFEKERSRFEAAQKQADAEKAKEAAEKAEESKDTKAEESKDTKAEESKDATDAAAAGDDSKESSSDDAEASGGESSDSETTSGSEATTTPPPAAPSAASSPPHEHVATMLVKQPPVVNARGKWTPSSLQKGVSAAAAKKDDGAASEAEEDDEDDEEGADDADKADAKDEDKEAAKTTKHEAKAKEEDEDDDSHPTTADSDDSQ